MFEYKFWDDKNRKILRHCDVTFDENVLYKDKKKKGYKTTKQVGVKVELLKISPSDVVADTQKTPKTVVEVSEVEQLIPDQVLRISFRTIRVPDRYSPSLHYRLLTDEGELESLNNALLLKDTTKWEKVMDDGMSRFQKCVALSSTEVEYVAIAEAEKEMI